ncbi:thioredoxin domain-containing protein [Mangrovicoccus algicola]|uniref:hypothetical protein n=1 Tax=Mangrovicoccus algicola TaxID=2771008 RepID=UPI001D00775E|nr:hypothetical protein [Mangrovicoccus algicola]
MTRPDIVLYTANTMNGWKPLIFLHEAQIDYRLVPINFSKKEQKAPDYMRLNASASTLLAPRFLPRRFYH